ncbi:uncharacterized protein LOC124275459 [Haliotis rubra]|uniref:uncharacterized protein LOC124275459 n=1 Tax=Haliotis rubra TaxID=36100 RepID=UPI001EE5233F|nr:uncharacterized protein LOC124275459 [Haliotis rubra]
MLRITCLVFVLAVVAMVSSLASNRRGLTKAVIKASGNTKLRLGGAKLFLDADGMAESCEATEVERLGGISYTEPGDSAEDALAFASKLGDSAELANARKIACDAYKCPDGTVIGACAFKA